MNRKNQLVRDKWARNLSADHLAAEAVIGEDESGTSLNMKKRTFNPRVIVPNYWYVYPLLILLYSSLYYYGYLVYVAAYYLVFAFTTPHGDWNTVFTIFRRLVSGPFHGYPLIFNLVGMGIWSSRIFLLWPLETFFWHLDDIIFPGYKNVKIERPLFLIGQPRSGTTKMESLLSMDSDLISLKMYEIRFPYLTYQYLFDFCYWVDKNLLFGFGLWVVEKLKLLYVFEHAGPLAEMRRLRYDLCDEDDLIFLFHFMNHFQLCGAFPEEEILQRFHQFDKLPENLRQRMMVFHRKCVQKVLYRRGGPNGRYFAKWVAGWNGELDSMFYVYPDAEFVCIVRDPQEQLPSWMKLQGLLSNALTGVNMMKNENVREIIKKENIRWFHNEIRFVKEKSTDNFYMIPFETLYQDIPGCIRNIYKKFDHEIEHGGEFDRILKDEQGKQSSHKKTQIYQDETFITAEEIKTKYPDLVAELEKTGKFNQ